VAGTEYVTFGGTPSRNMVNLVDKNVLDKADPEDAELVLWKADLGSRAYGGPIISAGKVFVGTNNERPRNNRDKVKNSDGDLEPVDKGIVMAFDEKTGNFLWQAVHDKLPSGQVNDWPKEGVCATPAVDGDKIYYSTNRCTIVCAYTDGRTKGAEGIETKYKDKTDAAIVWEYDMIKELGVFPHNMTAASPLIIGDILFVVTANGVDENHINIPAPQAPSFIALDKNNGKLLWKRNDPGKNIMHGQWANPCYCDYDGVKQVIFPGGDGWIYSFTPEKGDLIWKFDANPKATKYDLGGAGNKSDFIGTPVFYNGKIFIGTGQDPEHFSGIAYFYCIDLKKAHANAKKSADKDVSPELVDQEVKNDDGSVSYTGKPNPNSAVEWVYGGQDKRKFVPRDFVFGRTMSTACIVDDVVYISELQGYIHCLDVKTGKKFWQYDMKSAIWGSPYYVDGKILVATEGGDLFTFKHTKTPKVIDELDNPDVADQKAFNTAMKAKRKQVEAEYLLSKVEFEAPIRSTPVVANGILYVMSETTLYAFKAKK
jgi:outer membrane protein assembly factor BamB